MVDWPNEPSESPCLTQQCASNQMTLTIPTKRAGVGPTPPVPKQPHRLCCLYVPSLSPHDREYAVAVTLSPRELPDLLPPSLLGRLRCGTPAVGVWVACQ